MGGNWLHCKSNVCHLSVLLWRLYICRPLERTITGEIYDGLFSLGLWLTSASLNFPHLLAVREEGKGENKINALLTKSISTLLLGKTLSDALKYLWDLQPWPWHSGVLMAGTISPDTPHFEFTPLSCGLRKLVFCCSQSCWRKTFEKYKILFWNLFVIIVLVVKLCHFALVW